MHKSRIHPTIPNFRRLQTRSEKSIFSDSSGATACSPCPNCSAPSARQIPSGQSIKSNCVDRSRVDLSGFVAPCGSKMIRISETISERFPELIISQCTRRRSSRGPRNVRSGCPRAAAPGPSSGSGIPACGLDRRASIGISP